MADKINCLVVGLLWCPLHLNAINTCLFCLRVYPAMYLCVRGINLGISTIVLRLSGWVHSVALCVFHFSFYMNQHLDKEHITL